MTDPHYTDPLVTLYLGDCIDVMRELPDGSVDSVVTDPPYGLEFMGKEWDRLGDVGKTSHAGPDQGGDLSTPYHRARTVYSGSSNKKCRTCGRWAWDYPERKCSCETPDFPSVVNHQSKLMQAWHEQWAIEAFRVLKPGGYLLAFGGTRTYHRLASAIEDAGFEIRDTLMWIYASGFPKSLDVSKALDKVAGAEREVIGPRPSRDGAKRDPSKHKAPKFNGTAYNNGEVSHQNAWATPLTAPATDLARKWEGWGTALKPAHEPIVMARKPLIGTVAANVQLHGTGALNIDGTRIGYQSGEVDFSKVQRQSADSAVYVGGAKPGDEVQMFKPGGRWPSNVLLSSPELFDEPNPGVVGSGATPHSQDPATRANKRHGSYFGGIEEFDNPGGYGDSGGYSRFFLIPKASRAERERGLARDQNGVRANTHPTVKPINLMRHLIRLVTPPGGIVLDPFLGSGTTAIAASEEGFYCIGIEREAEYVEIAKGRITATNPGLGLR